jgi:hypothetical protein
MRSGSNRFRPRIARLLVEALPSGIEAFVEALPRHHPRPAIDLAVSEHLGGLVESLV